MQMQHCNKYHHNQNLPVFDTAGPCPACLRESNVSDDHAMCCGAGGERISRHNNLRDAVYETPVAAGLGPVKVGRFLLPGTDRRPADILVPNWVVGKDAAMDVTIVTPLQAATMPAAAQTAGHALNHAYDQKVNEAEELCRRQGIAFLPLVAETFGGWHAGAEREVKKLGAALARHTGQEEGEAISHLWSRMGILLQRGNASQRKVVREVVWRIVWRIVRKVGKDKESWPNKLCLLKVVGKKLKNIPLPPPTRFIRTYPTHCNNKYLCYNVSLSL